MKIKPQLAHFVSDTELTEEQLGVVLTAMKIVGDYETAPVKTAPNYLILEINENNRWEAASNIVFESISEATNYVNNNELDAILLVEIKGFLG